MSKSQNQLLAMMSAEELKLLRRHITVVNMAYGQVLADAHEHIRRVYFPHGGIISFVVPLEDGNQIETGMIGADGVMGASQALDHKVSLNKIVVKVPSKASVIDPDRLRGAADKNHRLRTILICYEQFFVSQVQQAVACNASHMVEQRMCRWLLRMSDLVGTEFPLTQAFLAQMIGAGRPTVSLVAGILQKAGLISYSRGHIKILDLDRLHESACKCHKAVCDHHAKIFQPLLAESACHSTNSGRAKGHSEVFAG